MSIALARELKGFACAPVMNVEMNTFDIDLILPSLFFLSVSEGQFPARRANDATHIETFSRQLAERNDVHGFEHPHNRVLLDRLVRTAVVQVGTKGQSGNAEQIDVIREYSILAFKPGFPTERSRLRRVDSLLYELLVENFGNARTLRNFMIGVFGKGAVVQGLPSPGGHYDGRTTVDTLTRLMMAYVEGFAPTGARSLTSSRPSLACPAVGRAMAGSITRYLQGYHRRMPPQALAQQFKGVINLWLFTYTVKLMHALPRLVEDPHAYPAAMGDTLTASQPSIYLDFTGEIGSPSREVAMACVRRELAAVDAFIHATLTVRQLHRYVNDQRGDPRVRRAFVTAPGTPPGGPRFLSSLLAIREDDGIMSGVNADARRDLNLVRRENLGTGSASGDDEPDDQPLDRVIEGTSSDFERIVLLLAEGQRAGIGSRVRKWLRSVGGLEHSHGLLQGNTKGRQSWRYAPSNDLLATLVQLAAIDTPEWDDADPRPRPIGLRQFLEWLELRFGILVDRPPAPYTGAEYVAAAQENLAAMLHRLQQMGIYRGLSDDFTVQRLIPPYMDD